jgi:hypothetical protein
VEIGGVNEGELHGREGSGAREGFDVRLYSSNGDSEFAPGGRAGPKVLRKFTPLSIISSIMRRYDSGAIPL